MSHISGSNLCTKRQISMNNTCTFLSYRFGRSRMYCEEWVIHEGQVLHLTAHIVSVSIL